MYLCLRQLAAEVLHLLLGRLLGAQLLLSLALQGALTMNESRLLSSLCIRLAYLAFPQ